MFYGPRFRLSIKKAKNCGESRRKGWEGRIVLGYSIRLILFSYSII